MCKRFCVHVWFQMKTWNDYFGEKFTKAAMETSIRKTKPDKKMKPIQRSFCRCHWLRIRCRCEIVVEHWKRRPRRRRWRCKCYGNVRPVSFQCTASHAKECSASAFWFQLATGLLHLPIIKRNGDSICFYFVDHWMALATTSAQNCSNWLSYSVPHFIHWISSPFAEHQVQFYSVGLHSIETFTSRSSFGATKNCHDFPSNGFGTTQIDCRSIRRQTENGNM